MQDTFTYSGRTFEIAAFEGDEGGWSPDVSEIGADGTRQSFYIGHEDDPDVETPEEAIAEGRQFIIESVSEFGR